MGREGSNVGGFFGVVSKQIASRLFTAPTPLHYVTRRVGWWCGETATRIHDIGNTPFRTKFEPDLHKHIGNMGLGVISDYEDQPMLIGTHHGRYAM
jgi:amidophosphoribosyltransferase